ncbi:MAG: hypothetical protein ABEI39_03950 [Halobacteriales archaeon]
MASDTRLPIAGFVVLLVLLLGGTLTSPMTTGTKAMVSVGLAVFGVASFYLGYRYAAAG